MKRLEVNSVRGSPTATGNDAKAATIGHPFSFLICLRVAEVRLPAHVESMIFPSRRLKHFDEKATQVRPSSPDSQQTSPEKVRCLLGVFNVTQR
jgi:hypothetical protein